MRDNIFARLLVVLGINAALGAVYWAIVQYVLATQDMLAPAVLERTEGSPQRIAAYLGEVSGAMLQAGLASLLIAAVLAGLWLILVDLNPPGGPQAARRKRGSWAGILLALIVVAMACFWFLLIGAVVEQSLADNVPVYAAIYGIMLAVLGYWISTGVAVPASTTVAVPLARMIRD